VATTYELSHLRALEAEAIHVVREVAAEFERPVLLFSGGKDSIVMLHLATRAFWPARLPFPVLHVDTGQNFEEVIAFRDRSVADLGVRLAVGFVQDDIDAGRVVEDIGPGASRNRLQTVTLLRSIEEGRFDAVFGGARRDEEKSRAKERIFSFRSAKHRWDPKHQRPELWRLYNARKTPGETIRVFPLSNWTELDVWQYIHREDIPIVPLYFAAMRPVVRRDGQLIMVDDERLPLDPGETPQMRMIRFRTLGCYPLTGAVESTATDLLAIVEEMLTATSSERQGRVIDHDQSASMEKKKQEGYF
jgi:sulfate adenylyltransferase subunit 2